MKQYFALFIISTYSIISAMNIIQLPSDQILKNRLYQSGLKDLVDKTDIHTFYAHKKIYPQGAVIMFEVAATSYYAHKDIEKTPPTVKQLQRWKPIFIKTVLADYPEAIKQLQKNNVLK